MTARQQESAEQILNIIKQSLFPLLAAFMLWYLNKLDKHLERMQDNFLELKINQRVIQSDLAKLQIDTTYLRDDVEELKKNLDTKY